MTENQAAPASTPQATPQQQGDSISIGKDTIYGLVIVILVAGLVLSTFTQGFGIMPCKSGTTGTGSCTGTTLTGTQNTTGSTLVTGVPQLSVATGSLPVYGQASAPVTWIEFSDYQCPYCAKLYTQTDVQVKSSYVSAGKVKIYFRDLPLSFHDKAADAAMATRCANEQGKYWEMHDKLFTDQSAWSSDDATAFLATLQGYATGLGLDGTKFNSCMTSAKYSSAISQDMSDGGSYGVSGTPGVLLVLPKAKTDYASLKAAVGTYSDGMTIYQDSDNYIVFVAGAYPYSAFTSLLDTVTY